MKILYFFTSKITRIIFIGLLVFSFSRASAQETDASKQQIGIQSWKATLEYILPQIQSRLLAGANMNLEEAKLFQSYYAQDILNENRNVMRVVKNDSINNLNAEGYINYEVAKYLDLYNKFKQLNSAPAKKLKSSPAVSKKNTPGVMTFDDDTIRPDPGICQAPCDNLSFQNGTMDGWKECGSEAFYVDSNALYPGSPLIPWGWTAYLITRATFNDNHRMKADCYGPTGGLTQAANSAGYLPTSLPVDYQLHICNAGKNDSIDPTVPQVYPGMSNSVMLGDFNEVSCGAAILEQKFSVTQANAAFTYMYAAFIENPSGHGYFCQPTFNVNFFDQNGDTITGCGNYLVVGGPNNPGFYPVQETRVWAHNDTCFVKPWTCVFVSLKKYIGQCVTVQFITRDCCMGAHFAYAYIDAKCDSLVVTETPTGSCKSKTATLTAPTSCGIGSYQWSGPCITGPTNGSSITVTCDGIYQVIITSLTGGCSDTLTDTVKLASTGGLKTDFVSAGTCGNMTFTDADVIANSTWDWQFPGGTPANSTSQNPGTISYPPGTYSVTLIVSADGCADTVVHTFTVTSVPLVANFKSSPVCIGLQTQFTDLSTGPPTTWNWNFGDGNTSTTQNPSNTYNAAGTYTVTLIAGAGACGAGDTIAIPVTVNPTPVSSFKDTTVCLNDPTAFTDLSTGNNTISGWSWNFGDGGTSTQQNPAHTYSAAGTYTASLVVTNNFGCKDSFPLTAIVNPSPVVNFIGSTPVCLGASTCFTDLSTISTGTITGWSWDFGDPASARNTSILQNPCHTFSSAGTFSVTLTATSSNNCLSTTVLTATVNPSPTALFSSTSPCLGSNTTLINGSTSIASDPITSWNWAMTGGNPATATSQNTSTSYNTAGTHSVTLIVTTQSGCKDTIDQQVFVYHPPVALFNDKDSGCAPLCHTFTDLSQPVDGTISNWDWSFPGGSPNISLQTNPGPICYNAAGNYNGSIIVTTNYGCKDTFKLNNIIHVYAWPNADFCIDQNKAPATDPVFTFCPEWTPNPGVTNWVWNFGDGSALDSTSTHPVHSYSVVATANDFYSYDICLKVRNQFGCWDTICKTVELIPEFTFYIPNTFTPNGDHANEFFFGKGRGIKDYNIWLFDRWGNMIWDCHYTGKNTDWDGSGQDGMPSVCKWDGVVVKGGPDMNGKSGVLAQEDVYVWKVKLTDVFNKQHNYIGHVSIIK